LGGGFAGLAISRKLLAANYKVIIITRSLPTVKHPALKWVSSNYADEDLLRSAISTCRTIIHAASNTTPGISAKTPVEEVFGNFHPSLELIQVLQEFPDRHLIYLSSGGAIYGNPEILPANEKSPCKPISYYGAGKLAVESFFQVMNYQCGCPVTILRPSNFYGPGQKPEEGFGLIFHLLHRAKKRQAIDIWGDGSTVRDYLYIYDFVEACMKIMATGFNSNKVKIYNVGSEAGYSINEVIDTVEEVIGTRLKKNYLAARPVDVKKIVLDCQRIKEELDWLPVTELRAGIKQTWEWMNTSV